MTVGLRPNEYTRSTLPGGLVMNRLKSAAGPSVPAKARRTPSVIVANARQFLLERALGPLILFADRQFTRRLVRVVFGGNWAELLLYCYRIIFIIRRGSSKAYQYSSNLPKCDISVGCGAAHSRGARRNSEGERPKCFLKSRAKCWGSR